MSCGLGINKVGGWCDLVEYEFWVWPYLCEGTVTLKFRQINSAVCDAFGVFFVLEDFRGGVVNLVGVWTLG